MIKVAQFSTNDKRGGAAIASYRLYQGFDKIEGFSHCYFVKNKTQSNSKTIEVPTASKYLEKVERHINHKYIVGNRTKLSDTQFSCSSSDSVMPKLDDYDIINLHWVECFLSLRNLLELTCCNIPIVWTLHDMKPFTGGCHYSSVCEQYLEGCDNCLQLANDCDKIASTILEIKKSIFCNANLTIVSPSIWLANEARKSSLFQDKRIEVIPNGIDSDIFFRRPDAKRTFGLSEQTIVLAFGALDKGEKRKGFSKLVDALELLKPRLSGLDVVALKFGGGNDADFPIDTVNAGFLTSEEELSFAYSAADIFVLPSLEDNLPNTILESMSCETPVIAFDTGGARDIINSTNGALVEKGNVAALANAIMEMICNRTTITEKGRNSRLLILDRYQYTQQAEAYSNLFKELTKTEFKYKDASKYINSNLDVFFNELSKEYFNLDPLSFSVRFNNLFNQVIALGESRDKYVLYGNGVIAKTIRALIPDSITGYVDQSDEEHLPITLLDHGYDKVIVTPLGRESVIVKYLVNEVGIDFEKIIQLEI